VSKAVLISGAGARIGAHFAKGLALDGWAVAVHYNRSRESALKLVAEIQALGGNAAVVQANLSIPHDVESLIERSVAALGKPLDALINNASTFSKDLASDFTRATFSHHMEVNLQAPLILCRSFTAQLPAGKSGVIINMIDQRVLNPDPTFFTYSISKSALYWATKTLAQSLAPRIRVNAIGPGPSLQSTHQDVNDFA